MKKIEIYSRSGKYKVRITSRNEIISSLYTPYQEEFLDYSYEFKRIFNRFKNKPLKKYKLTPEDKKAISNNPDYALDIPRYVVEGYDNAVGSCLDSRLRDEFYSLFLEADEAVISFINNTNDNFFVKVKER